MLCVDVSALLHLFKQVGANNSFTHLLTPYLIMFTTSFLLLSIHLSVKTSTKLGFKPFVLDLSVKYQGRSALQYYM